MASRSLLRVAVVQFAPKLGEVHANIAKARELCRGLTPRSVDLVCFPEMVFTGYMFPDAPSIAPFLEHPRTGPTASFCTELARRLRCVVVAGFPERLASTSGSGSGSVTETPPPPPPSSSSSSSALIGANAALVCDASGHLVHTYHKSNLFPVDQTWARTGSAGFRALDLPAPLGRTAIAICNDLNVRVGETWVSIEHGPYELAEWCAREGVRVLVLLNAWLRPEDGGVEDMEGDEEDDHGDGDGDGDALGARSGEARHRDNKGGAGEDNEVDDDREEDALEPNWRVLNYWAIRLRPLWAADAAKTDVEEETGQNETSHGQQDVIVVVCNRFGRERGKTFAGSSAMFAMRRGSGRPRLLQVMGEREEGVRVWTARVASLLSCSSP